MKKVIVFFGLIFIIYGSVGAFADLSPSPEEQAYNDALWKRESEYCEAHGGMPKVMTNTD
ncbi:hypothetical protein KBC03_05445 [Patescibacteria group bacterium]|nr:hypothetical protein [Patescibacteria group bacterium]